MHKTLWCPLWGSTTNWKVVRGCATFMAPFFQASWHFLAYHLLSCTTHEPPFSVFWKQNAFSALFLAKISALKMQNFKIFAPKTTHFSRKSCSLDLTYGNLRGTYPQKKRDECPSPACILTADFCHFEVLVWHDHPKKKVLRHDNCMHFAHRP